MKSTNNYLNTYRSCIVPKLQEIDLYIKTSDDYLNPSTVASLLELSEDEVRQISNCNNITKISRHNFFDIMLMGSSFICGVYRREVECGSPFLYTPSDIAYIYQLDVNQVNTTCTALGIREVTAYTLPSLLAQIAV